MVSAKDVMALMDDSPGSYISVQLVAQRFGWTNEKAARVILRLWEEGLIVPTDKSYFGKPYEGSKIPYFTHQRRNEVRSKYYQDETAQIEQLLDKLDEGITVSDLVESLGVGRKDPRYKVTRNRWSKILDVMVQEGKLIEKVAEYAKGMMGRPPRIFGRTEDDIYARDLRFKDESGK
jgi:hypothetical protein